MARYLVSCPSCKKMLQVSEFTDADKAKCPQCGAAVPVPETAYSKFLKSIGCLGMVLVAFLFLAGIPMFAHFLG